MGEKKKKLGKYFPVCSIHTLCVIWWILFISVESFINCVSNQFFLTLIKTSYVYFFNRRTDMYLKSLNRASSLAKAIAERKTVPQLGKKLWIIILWNVLTIFNNKWNVLKVFATFKVSVLPKGTSVACIYYIKTWYQLYIMGIWFHNIFTKKTITYIDFIYHYLIKDQDRVREGKLFCGNVDDLIGLKLNLDQRKAIEKSVTSSFSLIQGPPGLHFCIFFKCVC